jgi:hypothetical protein
VTTASIASAVSLDEMQHQSVDALVGHHELHRPEGAF